MCLSNIISPPTITSLKRKLQNYEAQEIQEKFTETINSLIAEEPVSDLPEHRLILLEKLPIEVLETQEELRGPDTVYRTLKDSLLIRGLGYLAREERKITVGIERTMYATKDEIISA